MLHTGNYNMILNNTITGITGLSCIGLQGDSDYNMIIGNIVTSNPIWWNAGIMLDIFSSNNHVFNNTALDNTVCDIVDEGGTDNTYKNNTAECTSGL